MSESDKGRGYEHEIVIEASIEDVWEALTTGPGIERWFAVDGRVDLDKGEWEVGWGGDERFCWTIDRAIEGQVLTLSHVHEAGGEKRRVVSEFILRGEGGTTTLRMVSSGWGTATAWDAEYDGTNKGWKIFVRNLRFALSRPKDEAYRSVAFGHRVPGARPAAWKSLFGAGGLFAVDATIAEAVAFSMTMPGGEPLRGVLDVAEKPGAIGGSVESLGPVLIRFEVVPTEDGNTQVHLMALGWGAAAAENGPLEDLMGRVQSALESAYPSS